MAIRKGGKSLLAAWGMGKSRCLLVTSFWNKDAKLDYWHAKWELTMRYLGEDAGLSPRRKISIRKVDLSVTGIQVATVAGISKGA